MMAYKDRLLLEELKRITKELERIADALGAEKDE